MRSSAPRVRVFPAGEAVHRAAQFQMLFDGERIEHAQVFRQHADHALHAQRLFGDVAAGDQHLAAIGRQQAGQDLQQRRLARAIRPQQRADAARQVEGDVIESGEFPKSLARHRGNAAYSADYRRSRGVRMRTARSANRTGRALAVPSGIWRRKPDATRRTSGGA
jgi:hypothetical protein